MFARRSPRLQRPVIQPHPEWQRLGTRKSGSAARVTFSYDEAFTRNIGDGKMPDKHLVRAPRRSG